MVQRERAVEPVRGGQPAQDARHGPAHPEAEVVDPGGLGQPGGALVGGAGPGRAGGARSARGGTE